MNLSTFPRPLAACAMLLALAGCASFHGIESTVRPHDAGDYASSRTLPGQGGQWPDSSWAGQIGGAPLQALVDEAVAGNPGMQVAAARVAAARAAADATGAAARPVLSGSLTGTYQRYTENGILPPPFAGSWRSDNQLALNFSYDLDFWGRHAADLRAALSSGKAAQAEEYNARLVLSSAVARSWLQLGRLYSHLDLNRQQRAVSQKLVDLTQLRIKAGLDPQTENQQSQQQLASLRAEEAQLQEGIELTRNQLAALLGQGPDRGQRIERPTLPPEVALALPDALPLTLLGRRPDIVAARWQVEAAQGDIDSAKTAFYPNVNLMAFAGFSSLGLSNLLQSGSRIAGIGPAIHLPILEGGALRAQLKGRVAAYDAAAATYNQSLTDALHEVADQVQSLRAAAAQGSQQHLATEAAATNLRLAQQREQVGTANMLPALASQMNWLSQRRIELDLQARRSDLRVALVKALGGGFDAAGAGLDPVGNTTPNDSPSAKLAS